MTQNKTLGGRPPSWLEKYKREALDLLALSVALIGTGLAIPDFPTSVYICAIVAAALVPLRAVPEHAGPWKEFLAAAARRLCSVGACAFLLHYFLAQPFRFLWFGVAWCVIAWGIGTNWKRVGGWISGWVRSNRWIFNPILQEVTRIALLTAAALWLMQGFLRLTLHGASDALWYSVTIADAVTQSRAGVFPIWVGQSIYQFNGSVLPIRIAPALQYFAVLLDMLTFRTLGVYTIINTLLVSFGLGGMGACYLALREILPRRRWLAAGLAALFISCPGVIGLPYNGDLYMSWTTVPLIPIVFFATIRSFANRGRTGTLLLLGASLGMCWWGHSPMAAWAMVLAGAAQCARLVYQWRDGIDWRAIIAGALVFGATAAYPVCSVILFPAEPNFHVGSMLLAEAFKIAGILRSVFPASILPLSAGGRTLSDFQVGYALWALFLYSVWNQRRSPVPASVVLLASALMLSILLLPLVHLELILWSLVPGFLRSTTTNWPMLRLCLQISGAIVFGTAAYASTDSANTKGRRLALSLLVAAGCAWSFSEASKFSASSKLQFRPPGSAVDLLRPENVQLSRFSYGFFPHTPDLPTTFTHGVTDPELENHLLTADMSSSLATNANKALAGGHLESSYNFVWSPPGPSNHAYLDHPLSLQPGKLYLLKFNFEDVETIHGVLQLVGPHLFREYALPEHGGPKSFGAGGSHSSLLPVRTTSGPESVEVRFYPAPPVPANQPPPPIATAQLYSYDRDSLPVRVDGWIPYRARVRSPASGWLETPRVFQTGYVARVDGHEAAVKETPEALVAVAVPAGESTVELSYVPPTGLRALFWLSFLSSVAAVAAGLVAYILHLLGRRSPAKASIAAPVR